MTPIGLHRAEPGETKTTSNGQVAEQQADVTGGRYRIRIHLTTANEGLNKHGSQILVLLSAW